MWALEARLMFDAAAAPQLAGVMSTSEFSIDSSSATEGGAVSFTVTRNGDTQSGQSVDWNTLPGTANGTDFDAGAGTLTFAPGVTSMTINVQTTDDGLYEYNEQFQVQLTNPTGGAAIDPSGSTATGTITNHDPVTVFSVANASAAEGNSSGVMVFTVTRTGDAGMVQDVRWEVLARNPSAGDTAVNGPDYTLLSGLLSFSPGETEKTFEVPIVDNTIH